MNDTQKMIAGIQMTLYVQWADNRPFAATHSQCFTFNSYTHVVVCAFGWIVDMFSNEIFFSSSCHHRCCIRNVKSWLLFATVFNLRVFDVYRNVCMCVVSLHFENIIFVQLKIRWFSWCKCVLRSNWDNLTKLTRE